MFKCTFNSLNKIAFEFYLNKVITFIIIIESIMPAYTLNGIETVFIRCELEHINTILRYQLNYYLKTKYCICSNPSRLIISEKMG